MHQELFPATLAHYKDLVRFVYKDDPLTELHPWAMHAAVDANCLAAQSGEVYWTYVDYLHAHGQEITGQDRDAAKSFAALDRIARQEATLGKLDADPPGRLHREAGRNPGAGPRRSWRKIWGLRERRQLFVNGERVNGGAVPRISFGW